MQLSHNRMINFIFQMENEIDVADRIGFALTFLSDSYLLDYIEQLTDSLVIQGDLAGILLTGL